MGEAGFMLYRVEGIVIRSQDYGEGNKIITIYSKETGKVGVMARGAKKLKSRHSAIAQLFTYAEFVFFRTSGLGTLNHGETINSHHGLREDLNKAAAAAYLVEFLDRLTADYEPNLFLFEQLKAALAALDSGKDAQITCHLMEMKLLMAGGYTPILDRCASCGSEVELHHFSVPAGGLVCDRCAPRDPGAIRLVDATAKLLRLFQQLDIRRLGEIDVKPNTKQQLKRCMREFIDHHVGIQLKSRSFLDQMEKYEL